MILVDNRNLLRDGNRELLSYLSTFEANSGNFKVVVEPTKVGIPTLKLNIDGKTQYLHSKYDPEKEAERLVGQLGNMQNSKHVLFVGCGLGYHIQKVTEQYPDMKFSIYEPNEEVLVSYLSNRELNTLPFNNLGTIFTGKDETRLSEQVSALLQTSSNQLYIYTLPAYASLYNDQIQVIMQKAVSLLKEKRSSLLTNLSFQKRWTVNSIKNFPTVLKTPNILHDIDKIIFEGKPAIIVAAGPSLNQEFENLRYIKENGLAYIFSVGSAINALIENGIYPDAACTYDPTELNQHVVQKIKKNNIQDIPLVFGSSVGFETLEEYPGGMLHMITNQDTISPQLLDTTQSIGIVLDAPSIAVVTFQLLTQLKVNPIILVGQNLSYQYNKRYASGIEYDFVKNELSKEEQDRALIIKDVYGNNIQTNDDFNGMRKQLEMHIRENRHIEVINTTRGGAEIEGTSFKLLEELINEQLKIDVVVDGWTDCSNTYSIDYTEQRLQLLIREESNCKKLTRNSLDELQIIQTAHQNKRSKNMEQRFAAFDKQFTKLKRNAFYAGFIEPMVRVQNERLSQESQSIRYESDVLKKAEVIILSFNAFLHEIHLHHEFVLPYFEEMKSRIEKISKETRNR